ncbi:MAG: hypothetical protein R6V50_02745 [Thermoplasmatota archaeon]
MKKIVVLLVMICLIVSPLVSVGVGEEQLNEKASENQHKSTTSFNDVFFDNDPSIDVISPLPGYLYLFQLQPIEMPINNALNLGYSVVVGRNLVIETESEQVNHVQFVARGKLTGLETIRWDSLSIDGFSANMDVSSGIYDISVYGFDEFENEVCESSTKVLYIKVGRDDFGISITTRFDGGIEINTPLRIGLAEFGSMINTGESKVVNVPLQNRDDTTVELRFVRTKILNGEKNVIQTNFNVETSCDTSKEYEVYLNVRFPFILLDGGQPSYSNNPYFNTKVGYTSYSDHGEGVNKVDCTFFFGRDSLNDPGVFRMSLIPESLQSDTKVVFFNEYVGIDSSNNEVFNRMFSVGFEPATELTITTIPSEAKISYDFGKSAGVPTTITFNAEGGVFDSIYQSFSIDPLPGYMNFDLTLLGAREFLYESDSSFDVTYTIHSKYQGDLIRFEMVGLPTRIYASCGVDLGELGDLSVASFAEIDMSDHVERIAMYIGDEQVPFVLLKNLPKSVRYEGFVDVKEGIGNLTFYRDIDEVREISVNVEFLNVSFTKTFELKNNYVRLAWDVKLGSGVGEIYIERDSDSLMAVTTSLSIGDWTFGKSVSLTNIYTGVSWDISRQERRGRITFVRDSNGGSPVISFFISHNEWSLVDTIELNNEFIEVYWDRPTVDSTYAEIGVNTGGNQIFLNTLSLFEDDVEVLSFGIGIQIGDHFHICWDNDNGVISNFQWSGNIINLPQLYVSMNLPGSLFTIQADLIIGTQGSVSLEFNQDVVVNFIDVETEKFKVNGHISFYGNRPLDISWEWGELGFFAVNTYGKSIGEDFSLKFYWDPSGNSNYRYGFNISAPTFLNTYLHVDWWKDPNLFLPRFWVIWNPLPYNWDQWERTLLWNYEWYEVP